MSLSYTNLPKTIYNFMCCSYSHSIYLEAAEKAIYELTDMYKDFLKNIKDIDTLNDHQDIIEHKVCFK